MTAIESVAAQQASPLQRGMCKGFAGISGHDQAYGMQVLHHEHGSAESSSAASWSGRMACAAAGLTCLSTTNAAQLLCLMGRTGMAACTNLPQMARLPACHALRGTSQA